MSPFASVSRSFEYVPVTALQDNYIWIVSDGRHAAVVDPGDAAPAAACLERHGWQLTAILLTHHHADHVGGVKALTDRFGEVPVYGPRAEAIATTTRPVGGGDTVSVAAPALDLHVIDVPGHTRGHIAYFQPAGPAHDAPHLFCGDTLFATGCGRLFEGTPAQMHASLDALAALPEATQVHCAHEYTLSNIRFALACEPRNEALRAWADEAGARRAQGRPTLPTTIGLEKRVNPFLRAAQPEMMRAVARMRGGAGDDALDTFTRLRAWKDVF
jgi:hydroxyacylglutathione hydrolase